MYFPKRKSATREEIECRVTHMTFLPGDQGSHPIWKQVSPVITKKESAIIYQRLPCASVQDDDVTAQDEEEYIFHEWSNHILIFSP